MQKFCADNVWKIVNSFANINSFDELDGKKIHSLYNGLILQTDICYLFDELALCF